MAKSTVEETSERKRISIPKADESVLSWWESQKDPGLSVRLLIRNEIERNGYDDTAFRPVVQLPRRGRPPVAGSDATEGTEGEVEHVAVPVLAPVAAAASAPAVAPVRTAPVHAAPAQPAAQPVAAGGFSSIDDLMNG